jgi:hypothetical protein
MVLFGKQIDIRLGLNNITFLKTYVIAIPPVNTIPIRYSALSPYYDKPGKQILMFVLF